MMLPFWAICSCSSGALSGAAMLVGRAEAGGSLKKLGSLKLTAKSVLVKARASPMLSSAAGLKLIVRCSLDCRRMCLQLDKLCCQPRKRRAGLARENGHCHAHILLVAAARMPCC